MIIVACLLCRLTRQSSGAQSKHRGSSATTQGHGISRSGKMIGLPHSLPLFGPAKRAEAASTDAMLTLPEAATHARHMASAGPAGQMHLHRLLLADDQVSDAHQSSAGMPSDVSEPSRSGKFTPKMSGLLPHEAQRQVWAANLTAQGIMATLLRHFAPLQHPKCCLFARKFDSSAAQAVLQLASQYSSQLGEYQTATAAELAAVSTKLPQSRKGKGNRAR